MHKIEIATSKDVDALADLLLTLFEQETDFVPNKEVQSLGLNTIIETPELGLILKLTINNKVEGMINLLFSISTALGGKVAIIEDFIINPEHRGSGLGQALFDEAIRIAKLHKCKRVSLITDHDNVVGQSFYKKQGLEASTMVPFRKVL